MTAPVRRGGAPLWLWWSLLGVVVVTALAVGSIGVSTPPTAAERVLTLTRSIACPQCAGQSVAESDVAVSREVRRDIAQRVEQGQTDQEILAYYASDTVFGPDALLNPPTEGVGSLVWVLPVVVLIGASVALGLAFRSWSAQSAVRASDEDRALVEKLVGTDSTDTGDPRPRDDTDSGAGGTDGGT